MFYRISATLLCLLILIAGIYMLVMQDTGVHAGELFLSSFAPVGCVIAGTIGLLISAYHWLKYEPNNN